MYVHNYLIRRQSCPIYYIAYRAVILPLERKEEDISEAAVSIWPPLQTYLQQLALMLLPLVAVAKKDVVTPHRGISAATPATLKPESHSSATSDELKRAPWTFTMFSVETNINCLSQARSCNNQEFFNDSIFVESNISF